MAKNQTTYTLKLDAEIGDLQRVLGEAQKSMATFMASGKAPKDLEKAFEKIRDLLGQITDKTGKPLDLKGLTGVGKNLDSVEESFRSIIRLLGDFDDLSDDLKLTFLSEENAKKVEIVIESLRKYQIVLAEVAKKEKELEAARKAQSKDEGRVIKTEKKVSDTTSKKESTEAKRATKQGQLTALEALGDSADPVRIAKLRGEIGELDTEIRGLEATLASANDELTTVKSALTESSGAVRTLEGNIKRTSGDALKAMKAEAEKLGISLEGLNGHKAAKQMEILSQRMAEFKGEVANGGRQAFNDLHTGFTQGGQAAEQMGEKVEGAIGYVKEMDEAAAQQEAFENKIKQFLGLAGAAQVLRRALRDAMQTITELDATMTEMAVVTDLTVGDYWDQLPEYSKQASDLGVSINSAYKAATLYYQQGLKGNEVTKISAETLKLAKIANLDAADATNKMTAALRGFNMELNEDSAQKISDVYSKLAAITAADVSEISSAMTKTASIASNAGMEFETTAAFLSQIIETTRESAETAGTAMKTIVARFQELKKDPAEIGEVDGEIVDANKIEGALRSVGVALRDSSGQFRELDDVFLELSSKWDGLDKNTQRYIATIAAGSRQQSRFIAMMSNYSRTQELVTAANNSAGASNEQFEKTLESLEAKMEKLKNAWHEFTMGIMDSDLVKTGVDIATKFLEVVNKATSALDGIGGSLMKISSVLGIFRLGQKIFNKIKLPLINFFADVVKLSREKGEESGKAFDEGARSVVNKEPTKAKEQITDEDLQNYNPTSLTKRVGHFIKDKTGVAEIDSGWSAIYGEKSKKEGGLRQSQSELAKLKQDGGDRRARLKRLEAAQTIRDANTQHLGENNPITKNADEAVKKAKKDLLEYDKAQKKVFEESQKGWDQVSTGLTKMGETAIAAGVGISMLGGLLQSMGLEEVGEGVSEFGNIITVAGTAVVTIIPIIKALSTALVTGGVSAQAAWWWAILIVAAVAALVVGIIAIAKAIKNVSPEAKLEQARAATQRAQVAADAAKESYEGLASALNSLGDKYKTLDELTVGTKEWTQAMLEANQEVLDLTEKYPELMEYVQSDENGVLRLDTESDEVQAILQQKQAAAMAAQNNVLAMKNKEARAEADVTYSKLSKDATAGTKANTEEIAKKIASGKIKGDEESIRTELEAMGVEGNLDKMAEGLAENVDELREFGKQLNQNDKELELLNESAATTARSMADMSGFTEEEKKQASQMMDGETYAAIKEATESVYRKEYAGMDKDEKTKEQQRIIEAQYGEGAKLEDGKVTLNGETVAEDLTEEDIINLGIAQKANEDAAKATEISRLALDSMVRETGSTTGAAIEAMFSGANGSELKYNQLDELKNVDRKQLWDSLTPEEQQAFGGSYEVFSNKFTTAITEASAVFEKASTAIAKNTDVSYMTAGQLSQYNQNLEKVKGYYGGEANSQKIQTATSELLSGKDEKTKGEIQSLINAADWSNTESLLALQLKLETQYGYTTEEAKQYVETLGSAAYATSSLTLVIDKFGDFYQASKRLSDSLDKLNDLQWEYNYALDGSVQAITDNLQQQADAIQEQFNLIMGENGNRNAALSDFSTKYAEGMQSDKFGADLSYYVKVDDQGNIDDSRFQEYLDSVGENSNAGKAATQWLEELKTQKEQIDEQTEAAKEAIEKLDELQDQIEQSYNDLIDVARESIISKLQEQINVEKEALDATKQANSNLIAKIQEQINDERQARQNEEAEKNIQKQQSQLSYLMMDTSGANALQAQNLEQDIQQAEQDYRDSLIDQTLQSLTDANEKAAEQRERQIALSEQQLTVFTESAEFERLLNEQVNDMLMADDWTNTQLGQLIIEQQTLGQTSAESQKTINNLNGTVGNAKLMALDETYWKNLNSAKEEYTTALDIAKGTDGWKIDGTSITAISQGLLRGDLESELSKSGLSTDKLKDKSVEQLQSYKNTIAREGTTDSIGSLKSNLGKSGSTKTLYDNAAAYYNSADFDGTKTYEEYLTGLKNARKTEIEEQIKSSTSNLHTTNRGLKTTSSNQQYKTLLSQYMASGGTEAQFQTLYKEHIGEITSGSIDGVEVTGINSLDRWEEVSAKFPDGTKRTFQFDRHTKKEGNPDLEAAPQATLNGIAGGEPKDGWLAMHNSIPYIYFEGAWRKVHSNSENNTSKQYSELATTYKQYLNSYKTGGIADFTGPAWLDGTPSHPEYVLNSAQTERFFSLVDVLENYKDKDSKSSSGDNYFEIEINVEKLENDYDVEQVADKIRRMIYEDATYRNTNAINHIR